jgi:hypothetical protein
MTCERCGCTEQRACLIDVGGPVGDVPCWWVRPGLCCACLTTEELEELPPELLEAPQGGYSDLVLGDGSPAAAAPVLYDAYGRALR